MPRAKGKAPAKKVAAKTVATGSQVPDAPPTTPSKPLEVALADDRRPLESVNVDSLSGEALRAYARRAGVIPRDVANLTEDRLRQNTKLVIQTHFELLSE